MADWVYCSECAHFRTMFVGKFTMIPERCRYIKHMVRTPARQVPVYAEIDIDNWGNNCIYYKAAASKPTNKKKSWIDRLK